MFYKSVGFNLVRVTYRFVPRPANVGHGHSVLVFEGANRLDLPLTTFAREAMRRLSPSSVRVYLYALLPFFSFLAGNGSGAQPQSWDGDPEPVRRPGPRPRAGRGYASTRHHVGGR